MVSTLLPGLHAVCKCVVASLLARAPSGALRGLLVKLAPSPAPRLR